MITFLFACALVIASAVGFVCISVRLYKQNGVDHPSGHQLVTLHQEASIVGRSYDRPGSRRHMERSYKKHRSRLDVGLLECGLRFAGLGLAVMVVVIGLVVILFLIH